MADHTHKQSAEEGSSFLTGFTIGLFTGAAGYYLFATQEGSKLRKQLAAEWDEAREHLADEGVIDNPHVSLREFISEILHKAFTPDGEKSRAFQQTLLASELEEGRKKAREVSNRAKKETTSSSKRFKGV